MMIGGMHVTQLVALSLRQPGAAARHVIAMQVPRDTLWTVLVLAAALNAILSWAIQAITPPLPPEYAENGIILPAFMDSPVLVFVFSAAGMVLMIHLLHWVGAMLGGTGQLGDMLASIAWMHILRVMVQSVMLVLLLVAPPMASLFALVVIVMSIWIMLHFINEGANLGSIPKTIGLLAIVFVGFVFGLSLILTVTGLAPMMLDQNV